MFASFLSDVETVGGYLGEGDDADVGGVGGRDVDDEISVAREVGQGRQIAPCIEGWGGALDRVKETGFGGPGELQGFV